MSECFDCFWPTLKVGLFSADRLWCNKTTPLVWLSMLLLLQLSYYCKRTKCLHLLPMKVFNRFSIEKIYGVSFSQFVLQSAITKLFLWIVRPWLSGYRIVVLFHFLSWIWSWWYYDGLPISHDEYSMSECFDCFWPTLKVDFFQRIGYDVIKRHLLSEYRCCHYFNWVLYYQTYRKCLQSFFDWERSYGVFFIAVLYRKCNNGSCFLG